MAAKKHHRKKRRRLSPAAKLGGVLVVIMLVAVAVYAGRQIYQWHIEQQILQRQRSDKQLFINQIAPEATAMQRLYHVPASITIAQAILESNWGTSQLAAQYHNLFGIKGTGPDSREMATKEYVNGRWIVTTGRFKVYDSWSASIKDHTALMINGTSGNHANYSGVTHAKDYVTAARALQQAGYATDPDYADKLINLIQTYNLNKYDN